MLWKIEPIVSGVSNLPRSISISSGHTDLGPRLDPCKCCVISIAACQGSVSFTFLYTSV